MQREKGPEITEIRYAIRVMKYIKGGRKNGLGNSDLATIVRDAATMMNSIQILPDQ